MKKTLLMCAVAVGLSIVPAQAAVITFNDTDAVGTSYVVMFDSNLHADIKAAALVTLVDYGTDSVEINVKLANITLDPYDSRVSVFAFDTSPNALLANSSISGGFDILAAGNMPILGTFELCAKGGGGPNCAGGGGDGPTDGQIFDFSVDIGFAPGTLGSSLAFDRLGVRFQSVNGGGFNGDSGVGIGRPLLPGEPTPFDVAVPVPEPASMTLLGLGLLGARIARRRRA